MCKRREWDSYVGVVAHGIVIFRNWNWISSWNSIIDIGKGHYCIAVSNPQRMRRGVIVVSCVSVCVCVTHDLRDKIIITLKTLINTVLYSVLKGLNSAKHPVKNGLKAKS